MSGQPQSKSFYWKLITFVATLALDGWTLSLSSFLLESVWLKGMVPAGAAPLSWKFFMASLLTIAVVRASVTVYKKDERTQDEVLDAAWYSATSRFIAIVLVMLFAKILLE